MEDPEPTLDDYCRRHNLLPVDAMMRHQQEINEAMARYNEANDAGMVQEAAVLENAAEELLYEHDAFTYQFTEYMELQKEFQEKHSKKMGTEEEVTRNLRSGLPGNKAEVIDFQKPGVMMAPQDPDLQELMLVHQEAQEAKMRPSSFSMEDPEPTLDDYCRRRNILPTDGIFQHEQEVHRAMARYNEANDAGMVQEAAVLKNAAEELLYEHDVFKYQFAEYMEMQKQFQEKHSKKMGTEEEVTRNLRSGLTGNKAEVIDFQKPGVVMAPAAADSSNKLYTDHVQNQKQFQQQQLEEHLQQQMAIHKQEKMMHNEMRHHDQQVQQIRDNNRQVMNERHREQKAAQKEQKQQEKEAHKEEQRVLQDPDLKEQMLVHQEAQEAKMREQAGELKKQWHNERQNNADMRHMRQNIIQQKQPMNQQEWLEMQQAQIKQGRVSSGLHEMQVKNKKMQKELKEQREQIEAQDQNTTLSKTQLANRRELVQKQQAQQQQLQALDDNIDRHWLHQEQKMSLSTRNQPPPQHNEYQPSQAEIEQELQRQYEKEMEQRLEEQKMQEMARIAPKMQEHAAQAPPQQNQPQQQWQPPQQPPQYNDYPPSQADIQQEMMQRQYEKEMEQRLEEQKMQEMARIAPKMRDHVGQAPPQQQPPPQYDNYQPYQSEMQQEMQRQYEKEMEQRLEEQKMQEMARIAPQIRQQQAAESPPHQQQPAVHQYHDYQPYKAAMEREMQKQYEKELEEQKIQQMARISPQKRQHATQSAPQQQQQQQQQKQKKKKKKKKGKIAKGQQQVVEKDLAQLQVPHHLQMEEYAQQMAYKKEMLEQEAYQEWKGKEEQLKAEQRGKELQDKIKKVTAVLDAPEEKVYKSLEEEIAAVEAENARLREARRLLFEESDNDMNFSFDSDSEDGPEPESIIVEKAKFDKCVSKVDALKAKFQKSFSKTEDMKATIMAAPKVDPDLLSSDESVVSSVADDANGIVPGPRKMTRRVDNMNADFDDSASSISELAEDVPELPEENAIKPEIEESRPKVGFKLAAEPRQMTRRVDNMDADFADSESSRSEEVDNAPEEENSLKTRFEEFKRASELRHMTRRPDNMDADFEESASSISELAEDVPEVKEEIKPEIEESRPMVDFKLATESRQMRRRPDNMDADFEESASSISELAEDVPEVKEEIKPEIEESRPMVDFKLATESRQMTRRPDNIDADFEESASSISELAEDVPEVKEEIKVEIEESRPMVDFKLATELRQMTRRPDNMDADFDESESSISELVEEVPVLKEENGIKPEIEKCRPMVDFRLAAELRQMTRRPDNMDADFDESESSISELVEEDPEVQEVNAMKPEIEESTPMVDFKLATEPLKMTKHADDMDADVDKSESIYEVVEIAPEVEKTNDNETKFEESKVILESHPMIQLLDSIDSDTDESFFAEDSDSNAAPQEKAVKAENEAHQDSKLTEESAGSVKEGETSEDEFYRNFIKEDALLAKEHNETELMQANQASAIGNKLKESIVVPQPSKVGKEEDKMDAENDALLAKPETQQVAVDAEIVAAEETGTSPDNMDADFDESESSIRELVEEIPEMKDENAMKPEIEESTPMVGYKPAVDPCQMTRHQGNVDADFDKSTSSISELVEEIPEVKDENVMKPEVEESCPMVDIKLAPEPRQMTRRPDNMDADFDESASSISELVEEVPELQVENAIKPEIEESRLMVDFKLPTELHQMTRHPDNMDADFEESASSISELAEEIPEVKEEIPKIKPEIEEPRPMVNETKLEEQKVILEFHPIIRLVDSIGSDTDKSLLAKNSDSYAGPQVKAVKAGSEVQQDSKVKEESSSGSVEEGETSEEEFYRNFINRDALLAKTATACNEAELMPADQASAINDKLEESTMVSQSSEVEKEEDKMDALKAEDDVLLVKPEPQQLAEEAELVAAEEAGFSPNIKLENKSENEESDEDLKKAEQTSTMKPKVEESTVIIESTEVEKVDDEVELLKKEMKQLQEACKMKRSKLVSKPCEVSESEESAIDINFCRALLRQDVSDVELQVPRARVMMPATQAPDKDAEPHHMKRQKDEEASVVDEDTDSLSEYSLGEMGANVIVHFEMKPEDIPVDMLQDSPKSEDDVMPRTEDTMKGDSEASMADEDSKLVSLHDNSQKSECSTSLVNEKGDFGSSLVDDKPKSMSGHIKIEPCVPLKAEEPICKADSTAEAQQVPKEDESDVSQTEEDSEEESESKGDYSKAELDAFIREEIAKLAKAKKAAAELAWSKMKEFNASLRDEVFRYKEMHPDKTGMEARGTKMWLWYLPFPPEDPRDLRPHRETHPNIKVPQTEAIDPMLCAEPFLETKQAVVVSETVAGKEASVKVMTKSQPANIPCVPVKFDIPEMASAESIPSKAKLVALKEALPKPAVIPAVVTPVKEALPEPAVIPAVVTPVKEPLPEPAVIPAVVTPVKEPLPEPAVIPAVVTPVKEPLPEPAVIPAVVTPVKEPLPEPAVIPAVVTPVKEPLPEPTVIPNVVKPVKQAVPEPVVIPAVVKPVKQAVPEPTVIPNVVKPVKQAVPEPVVIPAVVKPVKQAVPEPTVIPKVVKPVKEVVPEPAVIPKVVNIEKEVLPGPAVVPAVVKPEKVALKQKLFKSIPGINKFSALPTPAFSAGKMKSEKEVMEDRAKAAVESTPSKPSLSPMGPALPKPTINKFSPLPKPAFFSRMVEPENEAPQEDCMQTLLETTNTMNTTSKAALRMQADAVARINELMREEPKEPEVDRVKSLLENTPTTRNTTNKAALKMQAKAVARIAKLMNDEPKEPEVDRVKSLLENTPTTRNTTNKAALKMQAKAVDRIAKLMNDEPKELEVDRVKSLLENTPTTRNTTNKAALKMQAKAMDRISKLINDKPKEPEVDRVKSLLENTPTSKNMTPLMPMSKQLPKPTFTANMIEPKRHEPSQEDRIRSLLESTPRVPSLSPLKRGILPGFGAETRRPGVPTDQHTAAPLRVSSAKSTHPKLPKHVSMAQSQPSSPALGQRMSRLGPLAPI